MKNIPIGIERRTCAGGVPDSNVIASTENLCYGPCSNSRIISAGTVGVER